MMCRTRPRSPAGHPLPPGCRRRTPTWTPAPPIRPAVDTRQRLAGRRTEPTSRPSGRPDIPQFAVTAQPMALDPVRTATANRRTMPERPQAWSRPMSARSCPASTMDTTIGQPSGHRLPGRIRPDMVTSSRHAMATRKQCGQRTNERHRSPSDILDRHHHNGGPPDTPSVSCGAAFAACQPRSTRQWQHCQRAPNYGSCLYRSTVQAAPRAHCSPQTITGRA
jgi:hypothetical protein